MKLHFSLALATVLTAAAAPPTIPLRAPGGPVIANYQAQANPQKPYIAQLFVPGEKAVPLLEDSPADHVHHHGLMLAYKVNDTDFWAEKDIVNLGREVPEAGGGPVAGGDGYKQTLRWLATDGTPLLTETRELRVRTGTSKVGAVNWLYWDSTLTPAAGRDQVTLSGSHYYGLGMRFLPAWADHGKFVWQDTKGQQVVRGDERLTPGTWCAVRCEVDGAPVTVLMVDHPKNPRPVQWFTMATPFCYLSATLGLHEKTATLAAGATWTLRYGVAVIAGTPDQAELGVLAEAWRLSGKP